MQQLRKKVLKGCLVTESDPHGSAEIVGLNTITWNARDFLASSVGAGETYCFCFSILFKVRRQPRTGLLVKFDRCDVRIRSVAHKQGASTKARTQWDSLSNIELHGKLKLRRAVNAGQAKDS